MGDFTIKMKSPLKFMLKSYNFINCRCVSQNLA